MNKHSSRNDQMQNLAEKVSEKALKEDFPIEYRRAQHLVRQHDLVGAMIAKAMKQGDFDNLEGTGKPLNLDENPFEPVELRMVHKILKDNGYAPYWIELGKEIDDLRANLCKDVEHFKRYTQMVFSRKLSSRAKERYELKKNNFYAQGREHLANISSKILDYNLHCPVSLGRFNFNVDDEMISLVKDIENLIENQQKQE